MPTFARTFRLLSEAAKELVEGQKLPTPRRKATEPAKNAKDFRGATLCAFASLREAWHFFTASRRRLRLRGEL